MLGPCTVPFCDECPNSQDECSKCSANYRLNVATNECLRMDIDGGLTSLQIIGMIVLRYNIHVTVLIGNS